MAAAVVEAFKVARPLAEGAAAVGDPLQVLPAVYHALWCGRLTVPLDEPLQEQTLVAAASGNSEDVGGRPAEAEERGEG
ncbi:hypothetical protein [Streptomyces niger]|uniref:hypothetical protein n=1 Tax=Streptomyces niger TaxID=66373 RepID=UPI000AFAA6B9|nr:hypothetical protein [Streptomyces niger]